MNKMIKFLCLNLLLLGATAFGMDNPNDELFEATKIGDYKAVKRLLAQGASVDARTTIGWTPLMWAAGCGHADVCRLLIENNAVVDAIDIYDGSASLHRAAMNGHADVCRLLIESNALVEAKNKRGFTPLI